MKVVMATMELNKLRKQRLGTAAMSIQSKIRGVRSGTLFATNTQTREPTHSNNQHRYSAGKKQNT
jgi:hypothetical protein